MKILWRILVIFPLFFTFFFIKSNNVFAISTCPTDDPCKDKNNPFDKVSCYLPIVNICQNQRESMASQVTYLTTRIELSKAKIQAAKNKIITLEEEIDSIGVKIGNLEKSLTKITEVFLIRIVATYKYGDNSSYLNLLLTSNKFSDFFNRYKYIQTAQAHDRRILFQLQNSKVNFQDQKQLREDKKKELDSAKKQLEKEESTLVVQKKEKEVFLEITKNSEKVYQQNLSAAQKEADSIQQAASILSKAGVAKHVSRGDVIGIMGNTGFSTGAHLHFSVYNLKEEDYNKFNFEAGYDNPFSYLKNRQMTFNINSCDDVTTKDNQNKSIGSGSWEWPMANPIISQCFGHTPYSVGTYRSGVHSGVDMYDDVNPLIKSVDDGNAYTYRGGQSAGNGVFIFHPSGKMTLYWHLQ